MKLRRFDTRGPNTTEMRRIGQNENKFIPSLSAKLDKKQQSAF